MSGFNCFFFVVFFLGALNVFIAMNNNLSVWKFECVLHLFCLIDVDFFIIDLMNENACFLVSKSFAFFH